MLILNGQKHTKHCKGCQSRLRGGRTFQALIYMRNECLLEFGKGYIGRCFYLPQKITNYSRESFVPYSLFSVVPYGLPLL